MCRLCVHYVRYFLYYYLILSDLCSVYVCVCVVCSVVYIFITIVQNSSDLSKTQACCENKHRVVKIVHVKVKLTRELG